MAASNGQATRKRVSPFAVTVILVVLLLLGLLGLAGVIGEVLWFEQLGFLRVPLTQWIASAVLFVVALLGAAIPVFVSIAVAYRKRPVYAKLTSQIERYLDVIKPLWRAIMFGVPLLVGIFVGAVAAQSWQDVLLWWGSSPTGKTDPQFGLDVSFYLFTLPVLNGAVQFAQSVLLICLLAGVLTSYLYGGISVRGRQVRISKATRVQIAITAALYLLAQGAGLWLQQFGELLSDRGLRTGAMYQGVHALIPGQQILAGIGALVAVLFLVTAFTGKWRLPVIGVAMFVVAGLLVGQGYPWAIQTFQVTPDEKSLESEYIKRNIAATRAAYGLADVKVERYDAVTDAEPGALRNDAVTTANIRIIDPEVVSPTFAQLEQIRQYYKFPESLNVDRYKIDGQVEDTVSAVRDIDVSDQKGWYNRTLVYTHGYGLVAAYGNQRSAGGEPVFLENGIPTEGKLGKFEPRVYFGMNSPEYSIVGGKRKRDIELDYPADAKSGKGASADSKRQNMTTFKGDGGPVLSNIFTKLLYALKFQDMEILLSGAVVDGSQILYDRNPVQRVQKVAPYLTIDSAPYASVVDGRIVWIVDGYTTSANYPYSEHTNMGQLVYDADSGVRSDLAAKQVNYIRNSVKATVDAYSGKVTLYAWDTSDPVLRAWQKVYPGTIASVQKMSGDLLSHVRYPADLFKVQRAVLGEYHVTDADAFYSAEDKWRTPNNPQAGKTSAASQGASGQNSASGAAASSNGSGSAGAGANVTTANTPQPPYYLTLAAGANAKPAFSIYSTYIPAQEGEGARDILTGYLVANGEAGSTPGKVAKSYGQLKLLTLPKGSTIPGPGQVQNSFTTDSKVSQLLNILRQGESEVISGNLLTLPVGGGLLYVQPVYVKAKSGTSFPILQKVLVSFGDEIAFEDTLDAALDKLFGGNSGASAGDGAAQNAGDKGDKTAASAAADASAKEKKEKSASSANAALSAALQEMQDAISARDAAMKEGDWAAYGEADKQLREALEKALALE